MLWLCLQQQSIRLIDCIVLYLSPKLNPVSYDGEIDRLIKEYDQERDRLYAASLGYGSGYKKESEEEKIK